MLAAGMAFLSASCSPVVEIFEPQGFSWHLHASNCITGRFMKLESTQKKCAEPDNVQVVAIYEQCAVHFEGFDPESDYIP